MVATGHLAWVRSWVWSMLFPESLPSLFWESRGTMSPVHRMTVKTLEVLTTTRLGFKPAPEGDWQKTEIQRNRNRVFGFSKLWRQPASAVPDSGTCV